MIFGFHIVLCGHGLRFPQTVRGGAGLGLHDEKSPDPCPAPHRPASYTYITKNPNPSPHRAAGRKKNEKNEKKKKTLCSSFFSAPQPLKYSSFFSSLLFSSLFVEFVQLIF
jgi:hypothetical protein